MSDQGPIIDEHQPGHFCQRCPRLFQFIDEWRQKEPDWFNGPVPAFCDPRGDEHVKLLIIGLAPGLRGANRTGRPFTGDYAGDLLYGTLKKFGFASGTFDARIDDGLALNNCAIVNAVRCVPPQNKPVGAEINNCRVYLRNTFSRFPNLRILVTLGKIAHDSTIRTLEGKVSAHRFSHHAATQIGNLDIISSYHCSRYNTNTGVLTTPMFEEIFADCAQRLQPS